MYIYNWNENQNVSSYIFPSLDSEEKQMFQINIWFQSMTIWTELII